LLLLLFSFQYQAKRLAGKNYFLRRVGVKP